MTPPGPTAVTSTGQPRQAAAPTQCLSRRLHPPPLASPTLRRIPIIPATRPRNRKPHHHNPLAETQNSLKPLSPTASDDFALAAAFPRKPRVLEEVVVEEEEEEEEEVSKEVVDMAEWLWGMGMGRYVSAFKEHEADGEVLPCLTMDDLRNMGIGAVGARRKLLYAIQRLQPPPPLPPPRR